MLVIFQLLSVKFNILTVHDVHPFFINNKNLVSAVSKKSKVIIS